MVLLFIIASIIISLFIFLFRNKILTRILSALYLILLVALSIYAYLHVNQYDSVYYKFDSLGILLSFVLCLLSISAFYHSYLYLKRHQSSEKDKAVYYATLIMFITAMISAYFAENIPLLWVSIEATSLFVTFLVFHDRTKNALEAAWKYLFVSSVGLAIAFAGILFLSIIANQNGLTSLSFDKLLLAAKHMDTLWLKISFLLIFTGFSVKISLFPLFAVAIDAKTIAPSPVNALMSTALVNVGFVGIFRVFAILAQTAAKDWAQHILLIAGIVSIFIATIQIFRVKRLKRLYAFSSMEHMGIVALGLAAGGIGYYAAILQLIFHALVKGGLFFQIGQIRQHFKSLWLKDSGNYFKINPVGSLAVILGLISILAIPPSGLFISEFLTFKALFTAGQYVVVILALILLTVIIYNFVRFSFQLLYDKIPDDLVNQNIKVNPYEAISSFALFALVIFLGFNPPVFFTDLIHQALTVLN